MLRLSEFLPYRLSIASNAVSDRVAQVYHAQYGLKIPEWRVLAVVAEHDETTQAALVAATQMDKMTVSRGVAELVKRGLLERRPAEDRRTLKLRLSTRGGSLYGEIAPLALAIEAELLAGFSTAERDMLMTLLQRLEHRSIRS